MHRNNRCYRGVLFIAIFLITFLLFHSSNLSDVEIPLNEPGSIAAPPRKFDFSSTFGLAKELQPSRVFNEVMCFNKADVKVEKVVKRGSYFVHYNVIPEKLYFSCNESVTLTTQAEISYLTDNLLPLVQRWRGPISAAVFAPGQDFNVAVEMIRRMRKCSRLIENFVSFHLFYPANIRPKKIAATNYSWLEHDDCANLKFKRLTSMRSKLGLLYPINVARNVAREASNTHFVFPCDVELYPSPDFIPRFLAMIRRESSEYSPKPKV